MMFLHYSAPDRVTNVVDVDVSKTPEAFQRFADQAAPGDYVSITHVNTVPLGPTGAGYDSTVIYIKLGKEWPPK